MRYYINFCSWTRVPEPKTPDDAVPVGGTVVFKDTDPNDGNQEL